MAKKTNKTDHVLNLISGGGAKQESEASEAVKSNMTPPPVDPLAANTVSESSAVPTENSRKNPSNHSSPVSIVHTSTKEDHRVADSIKNSLEEELEKSIGSERASAKVKEKGHKAPVKKAYAVGSVVEELEAEVVAVEEPIHQMTADAVKEIKEVHAEEKQIFADEDEMEDEAEDEEPEMEENVIPKIEEDVYENRFRTDLEARLKEPAPEYSFVNVMEYLVRDKVISYMKQFGNCTCSRCIEDTAALTLTHLPSKYVVVNKAAIPPLLDYYGHKYAGQITVEITKSCIKVNQNPHHNRE